MRTLRHWLVGGILKLASLGQPDSSLYSSMGQKYAAVANTCW